MHTDAPPRGAAPTGVGAPLQEDRRIEHSLQLLRQMMSSGQDWDFLADPLRTKKIQQHSFASSGHITTGTVLHAIPYLHWYKVQMGDATARMAATPLGSGSFLPIGMRSTTMIPPNTQVVLWLPKGANYAFILGPIPVAIQDYSVAVGNWIQQGCGSGFKRELAHMQPIDNMYREGSVKDFSGGRPLDATCWDHGMIAETGVGYHFDMYQAYVRANEACGIFFNYWDSYTKLIGLQVEIQSFPYHLVAKQDEGENRHTEWGCTYPWEAVGSVKPDTEWIQEFDDTDVHYYTARGKVDLKEGEEGRSPIARYQEHGGYNGQGRLRLMMVPNYNLNANLNPGGKGTCVWAEHVALDGAYAMRSAKSIFIGKHSEIPLPVQLVSPEDQKEGEDARRDNYRFSGWEAWSPDNEEHNVQDPERPTGDCPTMLRAAGTAELLSHHYNWKSVNAFYYHKEDYYLPEEGICGPCKKVQQHTNFSRLQGQDFLDDPSPTPLKVDHRFKDVDYYPTETFLAMHDDGTVVLGDGYGSAITMSGGQIRLEPAGDLVLMPGKRLVALCWDAIVRAKNSVDISATMHDVRIKAQRIVQVLGGNGGQGGVLIESKANSKTHLYKNLYGEDVTSSGVVLLAKSGEVACLGSEVYLRTGGADMKNGKITIDAAKGQKEIVFYGKKANFYIQTDVNFWLGPSAENGTVKKSHWFSRNNAIISGNLLVEKNLAVLQGNLAVRKGGLFGKSLWASSLAHKTSYFVGKVDLSSSVGQVLDPLQAMLPSHINAGTSTFQGDLNSRWYAGSQLGSDSTIQSIGFSFRDPPSKPGGQYKTAQFHLPESTWQRWSRLGQGSGGVAWVEKPVISQGAETYPWPGKQAWVTKPTFMQFEPNGRRDYATGLASARPQKYNGQSPGHPEGVNAGQRKPIGKFNPVVANGSYQLVLNYKDLSWPRAST